MPNADLLLGIADPQITDQLLSSSALGQFNVITPEAGQSWLLKLASFRGSVAIVQVDDFSSEDCQALLEANCLSNVDIIFISSGEPNPAVDKAMRYGVSYHLRLPLEMEYVEELLTEIHNELDFESQETEEVVSSDLDQFGLLIGSSSSMRKLYRVIRKAATSDANVLIVGESGAGKELVANTIHLMSQQSEQPFVALNCGALTPELVESELFGHIKGAFTGANKNRAGVFQQAEGGTLFLDEVTEMSLEHQVKLLRVLETGEYRPVGSDQTLQANVRVISATNRNPREAISEERFREDLYFRLAHFPIQVPPLRERGKDITGLAKHFLAYRNAEQSTQKQISVPALNKIATHTWPGNVRELKHTLERAYILADDTIDCDHLILQQTNSESEVSMTTLPTGVPLAEVEKGVILKTLEQNDGNKSETASQLGVSVKTLYNKLEKYEEQ